jgi:hypothetical protein
MSIADNTTRDIERYAAAAGFKPSAFGLAVCQDGNLLRRVRAGRVTMATLRRIEAFIRQNPVDGFDIERSVFRSRPSSAPDRGADESAESDAHGAGAAPAARQAGCVGAMHSCREADSAAMEGAGE